VKVKVREVKADLRNTAA